MINPRVDGGRIMLLVQRRIVEEGANSGRARRWAYLLTPPVPQNPAQPVHGLVSKSTLRSGKLLSPSAVFKSPSAETRDPCDQALAAQERAGYVGRTRKLNKLLIAGI